MAGRSTRVVLSIAIAGFVAIAGLGAGDGPGSARSAAPPEPTTKASRQGGLRARPLTPTGPPSNVLAAAEVRDIVLAALQSIDNDDMTVAVVDRVGNILALYRDTGAGTLADPDLNDNIAVNLARTAGFFSNSRAPLSSRTVRFISGKNFPNGVVNTVAGPLYSIENTNRGCDLNAPFVVGLDVNPFGSGIPTSRSVEGIRNNLPCNAVDNRGCGLGIVTGKFAFENYVTCPTPDPLPNPQPSFVNCPPEEELKDEVELGSDASLRVNPGGIPIYRILAAGATQAEQEDRLLGGIGIAGVPTDQAEFAAFRGAFGTTISLSPGDTAPVFAFPLPEPGNVFVEGLRLPFVSQVSQPAGTLPRGPLPVGDGDFEAPFAPAQGIAAPIGYLVGPRADPVDLVNGLTAAEVNDIVFQAFQGANAVRAQVRLPLIGFCSRMVISVTNVRGDLLAHYRMRDALYDAVDVCPAKARNAAYFSTTDGNTDLAARTLQGFLPNASGTTAVSGRAIGFAGEPEYPSGIAGTEPGPFFKAFEQDVGEPANIDGTDADRGFCQQAGDLRPAPAAGADVPRNLPLRNGTIFFPGGLPLYKNGQLVGGIGVSGDGVEQDDLVAFLGQRGFAPPFTDYRPPLADQIDVALIDGVRIPWLKFPRNPFSCNIPTPTGFPETP